MRRLFLILILLCIAILGKAQYGNYLPLTAVELLQYQQQKLRKMPTVAPFKRYGLRRIRVSKYLGAGICNPTSSTKCLNRSISYSERPTNRRSPSSIRKVRASKWCSGTRTIIGGLHSNCATSALSSATATPLRTCCNSANQTPRCM